VRTSDFNLTGINVQLKAIRYALPIALMMAASALAIGPITADRPLAVVLVQMPGPTAAPAQQWNSRSVNPNQIVPSNSAVGVSSNMTTVDIAGGSCKPLLGLSLNFDITTVNAAGIMVTINRMSSDGTAVVSSKVLFNGPGLAAQGQKNIKFPGGDLDVTADLLAGATDCSHWRMDVSDTSMDPPGTFNSWTLKRRTAWFPFEHDLTHLSRTSILWN
jgi:subtilisin-like proprotein convertase family protein